MDHFGGASRKKKMIFISGIPPIRSAKKSRSPIPLGPPARCLPIHRRAGPRIPAAGERATRRPVQRETPIRSMFISFRQRMDSSGCSGVRKSRRVSPQNSTDGIYFHPLDDRVHNVDHPRRGATEDQHQAFFRIQDGDWSSGRVCGTIFAWIFRKSFGSPFSKAVFRGTSPGRNIPFPLRSGSGLKPFPLVSFFSAPF
jgi:hypothetical protein